MDKNVLVKKVIVKKVIVKKVLALPPRPSAVGVVIFPTWIKGKQIMCTWICFCSVYIHLIRV